ncbi:MAG: VCBS repeat-containing protein [Saprospiraceae bacterium]|nr:VCBS repeat-containing protein [Saprospiraceae bacterium]
MKTNIFSAIVFVLHFIFIFQLHSQNVSYVPLYTTSTFSKTINVSLPVGAMAGSASTSNGNAMYAVPLIVPQGTNGITPNISLAYSSGGMNGALGQGWSVSGLSMIMRVGSNLYFDGEVSPVNYDSKDRFAIDGSHLILKSGSYGSPGATYGRETEDFSVITSKGTLLGGPAYFTVESKDGIVMEFGNTADSKYFTDDNSKVYIWRLNRILYRDGNYIDFKYVNTDRDSRIDEINYTGNTGVGLIPYNKIKFNYLIRDDIRTSYDNGTTFRSKYLMTNITVTTEGSAAFKSYDLKYGKNDVEPFLVEIIEKGSDNSQLNSTIFKYGDIPDDMSGGSIPALTTYGTDYGHDLIPGDFDGDGYTDILAARTEFDHTSELRVHTGYKIVKRTATSGTYTQSAYSTLLPNTTVINKKNFPLNYQIGTGDFSGDGRDDIITYKWKLEGGWRKLEYIEFHYSNGTGFTPGNKIYPQNYGGQTYDIIYPNFQFFLIGDFNGNGSMDIILNLSNGGGYRSFICFPNLALSNVYPLTIEGISGLHTLPTAKYLSTIFYNSDSKSDIIEVTNSGTRVFEIVKIGSDYHAKQILGCVGCYAGYPTAWHLIKFGDFNGDGRTDLLTRTSLEDINAPWYISYNTGTGWNEVPFTFSGHKPEVKWSYNKDRIVIADFNGDGKMDINVVWGIFDSYSYDQAKFEIYYSKGDQFLAPVVLSYGLPGLTKLGEGIFDLNGDGRADLVNMNFYSNPLNTVFFKSGGKERLLEKSLDGVGLKTEYSYKRMNEAGSFYVRGTVPTSPSTDFHLLPVQLPMYLIADLKSSNGIGGDFHMSYTYEEARLHRGGKGFLGFMKTAQINNSMGNRVINENSFQSTYLFIYPDIVKTSLNSSPTVILNQKAFNYYFDDLGSKKYKTRLWLTHENKYLEGQYESNTYTYDAYGNVTYQAKSNNSSYITYTTVYGTFGTPVPAKPTSITINTTRTGEPAFSTQTTFGYNAIGQCTLKTVNPSTSESVQTAYTYYPLGNINTETITPNSMSPIVTTYTYDTKGRFTTSIKNPLNQTISYTNDVRWGKPTLISGFDGLSTTHTYDAFGRLLTTGVPQGYTITKSYVWDQNVTDRTIYYHKTAAPGKPDARIWYDLLGRKVKEDIIGFGSSTILSKTTYDNRGNVATTTNPYKSGETILTTTNTYDSYNRLSTISNTLGTASYTYTYTSAKLTVQTANPAGQVSSKTYDATGLMTSATDYGGTLDYTYGSHGQVKTVSSGSATLVTNTYDAAGRRISMNDVNAGTTSYTYDALGQVKTFTNAMSQVTTTNYDLIGRITSEIKPEGTTTYEYYPSGTGGSVNKLKKITAFSGSIKEYTYDSYGRTLTEKITVDGTAHTTTLGYNTYDDIITVSYPGGFGLNYNYNAQGYLQNIKNATNTVTLFSATSVNGLGQILQYTLGNTKSSTNTYHHGIPTRYLTTGIQDLNLAWNYATGNLTSRNDAIKSKTESFTYDNLNRLKTTAITSLPTITMNYAANGNISSKTDVGTYNYHGTKINAVVQIDNPLNFPAMIQNVTYNSFYQPATISEGTYNLALTYGDDEQRIKTVLTQGSTTLMTKYFFDGYEKLVSGGTTRYVYYINGGYGAGLVSVVERIGTTDSYFYTYTDHLGSILTVTNSTGSTIVAEQNFDAWGRYRNKDTWSYTSPTIPTFVWLTRGYTGHEHLREFNLVNMNGRLYDPLVARMLSPDNYVQAPDMTQNFNRYSYVLNNPLRYTDPTGDYIQYIFMAGAFAADYFSGLLNGHGNAAQSWKNVNDAMNALSSFTSVNLINADLGGGFSFNLGVGVSYGTTGFGIGLSAGIGYSSDNFDIGISAGIGYQFANSLGENGVYSNVGGGAAIGFPGFKAGLSTMQFSGLGQNQRTGSFNFYGDNWSISYENDWQFGLKIADGGDRWRTTGFRVTIGDYSLGLNMFTGDPDGFDLESKEKYRPAALIDGKMTYIEKNGSKPNQYRLGALYIGYKGTRLGYTSETIRHIFQNRFAHDFIQKGAAKHFERLSGHEGIYSQYFGIKNKYTTW